ncbi:MAG: SAM-dependent methyltransferase [Hyphomicrobiaceae bacterium]|nr:SAM-dependent methyltransferase [Hyphomicrobiaceae bacterium]
MIDQGQAYDPDARRDTPLARQLKDRIRREGPLSVTEFMRLCLTDPVHGYYVRQPAIGAAADFITAPEISQVFGELIGLWSAVVWQQMGKPRRFNLVELGPGRGTLMVDALRAGRIVAGFGDAADVHLIESNATLRDQQRRALASLAPNARWHDEAASALGCYGGVPQGPTIIIANEYLDAQPIGQWEWRGAAWHERTVGLDRDDRLVFTVREQPDGAFSPTSTTGIDPRVGEIQERNAASSLIAKTILGQLDDSIPFAALFIDYGYTTSGPGETLQAVERHRFVSPLYAPGDSDITAHVDFEMFAAACRDASPHVAIDGPVTQAEFLGALGIMERASRLMSANPGKAAEIEAGVHRLMAVPGMGDRFKAIAVRSASLPPLPGL